MINSIQIFLVQPHQSTRTFLDLKVSACARQWRVVGNWVWLVWIAELVWLNFMSLPTIKSNKQHKSCVMYVGLYAICVWNWNWWLTQDHFLIKHWSQRSHRCSAPVVGLEEYALRLVSRYSTARSETLIWREWGLWVNGLHVAAHWAPFYMDK